MNQKERQAEFNRLFESIPGKNTDRIKRVCEILFCQPNSVRIYRMKTPPRTIPESKLRILQRALGG
jgi:hypothetical protein